ncbi:MAG: hypothetical protein WDM79_12130 [Terricaulis sp.]
MTDSKATLEIAGALEKIRLSIQALNSAIAESNEPLPEEVSQALAAFGRATEQAIDSAADELRDNLSAAFGLARRPDLDANGPSHSHLRIDAAVNNLRDAIVDAEQLAGRHGYRAAGMRLPTIRTEVVARQEVSNEMDDVRNYLIKLRDEMRKPQISQIGIINIHVHQIDIKSQIASLIANSESVDLRGLGTAVAGISRIISSLITALSTVARALRRPAETILQSARKLTVKAFEIVRKAAERVFGSSSEDKRVPDRIWTESEVQELLVKGEAAPTDAAPFVRTLTLGERYSDNFTATNLDGLSPLKELRRVKISVRGTLDASALGKLQHLEHIDIATRGHLNLAELSNLPNLRELLIHSYFGGRHRVVFPSDPNWPRLEKITIFGGEFVGFPSLIKSPLLKMATISRSNFDPDQLRTWGTAQQLAIQDARLPNLDFLAGFDALVELDIRSSSVGDISGIKHATKLARLKMSRSQAERFNLRQVPEGVEITGDLGGKIRARKR